MEGESGAALDAALREVGWIDVLDSYPRQASAMAFELLGSTVSVASLLDDVLLNAMGLDASSDTCVVLPEPHGAEVPGSVEGGVLMVRGLASSRIDGATRAVVAFARSDSGQGPVGVAVVEAEVLRARIGLGIDPGAAYRRVERVSLPLGEVLDIRSEGWLRTVCLARGALAHELIGVSRRMLELARLHAIDRVQFGKPIASFQLVRARLAESLVAIEGAAAVAAVLGESNDPLVAATAKSLAGNAARTTAANAQQILAGIGFTTDHPFHLAMKRALVLDTLFGSAKTLPTEIGRELLARGHAPRLVEL